MPATGEFLASISIQLGTVLDEASLRAAIKRAAALSRSSVIHLPIVPHFQPLERKILARRVAELLTATQVALPPAYQLYTRPGAEAIRKAREEIARFERIRQNAETMAPLVAELAAIIGTTPYTIARQASAIARETRVGQITPADLEGIRSLIERASPLFASAILPAAAGTQIQLWQEMRQIRAATRAAGGFIPPVGPITPPGARGWWPIVPTAPLPQWLPPTYQPTPVQALENVFRARLMPVIGKVATAPIPRLPAPTVIDLKAVESVEVTSPATVALAAAPAAATAPPEVIYPMEPLETARRVRAAFRQTIPAYIPPEVPIVPPKPRPVTEFYEQLMEDLQAPIRRFDPSLVRARIREVWASVFQMPRPDEILRRLGGTDFYQQVRDAFKGIAGKIDLSGLKSMGATLKDAAEKLVPPGAAKEIQQNARRVEDATQQAVGAIELASQSMARRIPDVRRPIDEYAAKIYQEIQQAVAQSFLSRQEISRQLRTQIMGMTGELPTRSIITSAVDLVKGAQTSIRSAVEAIVAGMTRPEAILSAIGVDPAKGAVAAREAMKRLSGMSIEQATKIGKSLGLSFRALGLAVQAAGATLTKSAAGTLGSLKQITAAMKAALEGLGVTVSPQALRLAAIYVQQGRVTLDEAVATLASGAQKGAKAFRQAGVTAEQAAQQVSAAWAGVFRAAGAGGAAPPPPPGVPGGAAFHPGQDPRQVLQFAAALGTAQKSSRGLMQSLMALRWQLFTIMFFLYSAVQAARSFGSALMEGALSISRTTSAVILLRATGIQNMEDLIVELVEASGYFLDLEEAARKFSRVAMLGMPEQIVRGLPRIMEYARAFAALSDEYGNAEQVFDKLVDSIMRGQVRMAATAGATTGTMQDLLETYKGTYKEMRNWEGAIGEATRLLEQSGVATAKSTANLTAYQKQLLVWWEIVRRGETLLNTLGPSFDSTAVSVQKFNWSWSQMGKTIKAVTAYISQPFLDQFTIKLQAFAGQVAIRFDQLLRPNIYQQKWERAMERARQQFQEMAPEEAVMRMGEAISAAPIIGTGGAAAYTELAVRRLAYALYLTDAELGTLIKDEKEASDQAVTAAKDFRQFMTTVEESGETVNETADYLSKLTSVLQSFAELSVEAAREEEDFWIEHNRWWEDLQREYASRLADIERDANERRQEAQRDANRRRQDAEKELANRLYEIERDLAARLLNIWRDYNDEMFMATLNRDAMEAFMAARRRDRQIQEAQEEAARQREDAYRRYQEALDQARQAYQEQEQELRESYARQLEDLRKWWDEQLVERRIQERRQQEDQERARQRRIEDMLRAFGLEEELRRISGDKALTEEQRIQQAMLAIFQYYNTNFEQSANAALAAMRTGAAGFFSWLRDVFVQYYQALLNYRNSLLPLLTAPISPPSFSYPQYPPDRPPIRARQQGGVDYVTRPTLFLTGERGPEVVITMPMDRPMDIRLQHLFQAIIASQIDGLAGRLDAAVQRAIESVVRSVHR